MAQKKITIIYGLPDTNSGGSALGTSLIKVLKEHFPDYRINYVSSHSRQDLVEKAYPHLRAEYPDVNIIPAPLKARADNYDIRNPWYRKVRGFLWAVGTLLKPVILLCPSLFQNNTMKEIRESRLVVGRGTNVFYDKPGMPFRSFISMYWLCFPLLLSRRYGVPCVIYAQSIGPIHSRIARLLLRAVLGRCNLILCREEISADYVRRTLRIADEKIRVVPDSVFGLSFCETEKTRAVADRYALPYKRYLALTIREPMANKSVEARNHVFECLKAVTRHALAKGYVDKVAIVTQCHRFDGYHGFESDSAISEKLFRYLDGEKDPSILLLDEAFSPDALLALYGCARYLVSMRLHSVILGLIAGTPCVGLSYWGHKTVGIMKSLNMSDCARDLGTVRDVDLVAVLENIENNYGPSVQRVRKEVSRLHREAVATPGIIETLMNERRHPMGLRRKTRKCAPESLPRARAW